MDKPKKKYPLPEGVNVRVSSYHYKLARLLKKKLDLKSIKAAIDLSIFEAATNYSLSFEHQQPPAQASPNQLKISPLE